MNHPSITKSCREAAAASIRITRLLLLSLGTTILAASLILYAGNARCDTSNPARSDGTVAAASFVEPADPSDYYESGVLWVMPARDGRLRISPSRQWSRTGIRLNAGSRLELKAEGYVQGSQRPTDDPAYGPWGPAGAPSAENPDLRVCALIGRIVGEKEPLEFLVGENYALDVSSAGHLELGVSDVTHRDNSGEFVVEVRVDGKPVSLATPELTAPTDNLVPAMELMNGAEANAHDGIRRISAEPDAPRPMLVTQQCFAPPLEIRARVRTDSTNTRLYYGGFGWGQLIFNWEVQPDQLRIHDPATGAQKGIPGAGAVEKAAFHDITWRIGTLHMQVLVDGQERYRGVGDYRGVISPVGIGPALGSLVDAESLVVAPLDPASMDVSGRFQLQDLPDNDSPTLGHDSHSADPRAETRQRILAEFDSITSKANSMASSSAAHSSIRIQALFDGVDTIMLNGTHLWIEHEAFELPGNWDSMQLPIYVNGVSWMPRWRNKTSFPLQIPVPLFSPGETVEFEVTKHHGRESVKVTQQPGPENNWTLAVQVSDHGSGPDIYDFTALRLKR